MIILLGLLANYSNHCLSQLQDFRVNKLTPKRKLLTMRNDETI